jgi:hypothetical protein
MRIVCIRSYLRAISAFFKARRSTPIPRSTCTWCNIYHMYRVQCVGTRDEWDFNYTCNYSVFVFPSPVRSVLLLLPQLIGPLIAIAKPLHFSLSYASSKDNSSFIFLISWAITPTHQILGLHNGRFLFVLLTKTSFITCPSTLQTWPNQSSRLIFIYEIIFGLLRQIFSVRSVHLNILCTTWDIRSNCHVHAQPPVTQYTWIALNRRIKNKVTFLTNKNKRAFVGRLLIWAVVVPIFENKVGACRFSFSSIGALRIQRKKRTLFRTRDYVSTMTDAFTGEWRTFRTISIVLNT